MFISFIQFGFAVVKGKLMVWSCDLIAGSPELLARAPARTPEAASLDGSCFAAFWSPLPCLSIPCRECRGAGAPPGVKPAPEPRNLLRRKGKHVPKATP